jgi:uncharacterized iron-regulated membrane protein
MAKFSSSRLWFLVHSWIGLKLSLFMSFILITGTAAVFSHEIDWLLRPEMRASAAIPEQEVAWGDTYDSLQEVYPEARLISLNRYHNNAFALSATVVTEWRENSYLWFDPVDGSFLGPTSFYDVQRFFRNVHRHLMLPINIGVPVVTALALPLLVSLVAGLVVYKKFWRGFFRRPRFERKSRIWLGDLHRLAGLWSSWFIALIALTSVFYFAEEMGLRGSPFPRAEAVQQRNQSLPDGFDGAALEQAIAAARRELPALEIRRILFPGNSNGALAIQGDHSAWLVRPRANTVYVDPVTLQSAGQYTGEQLDFYTRISEAADPLHFGYFGGFLTQVIWFILGAAMSALTVTGIMIYARRLTKPATTAAKQQAQPASKDPDWVAGGVS